MASFLFALSLFGLSLLPGLTSCSKLEARVPVTASTTSVTDIATSEKVHLAGVKRFGINIGGQNFYDSGQMLRNLIFRNPGFEGETWRSILRCKTVTATACTDTNQYAVWPDNFLKDARFEFLSGPAAGVSGNILASRRSGVASPDDGVTFDFPILPHPPAAGDFVLVQFERPGNAEKGWWTNSMQTGATFSTEFHDLAPNTPGKQALRIQAAGAGQSARLDSYFDTYDGHSFVQLKGRYTLAFRAKGVGGNNQVSVSILRALRKGGNKVLFPARVLHLTNTWKDYVFDWSASEDAALEGQVDLGFSVTGADILLDDVSLTAAAAPTNPTAFRDEVVETLRDLKPGILRYNDTPTDAGSPLDNLIAPPLARTRAGFSTQSVEQEDIPLGLHEVLALAAAVHAEPWYALPATITPLEMKNLIEYLSGSSTTTYGARRASLGQIDPWTKTFPVIHLEFGNELWNKDTFYGAAIFDPAAYAERGTQLFSAARGSPSFDPGKFDLVLGSFAVNPWWTGQELAHGAQYNSVAVAPYLFYKLADTTTDEAIFGPMFAEPEAIDSLPGGYMYQQAKASSNATHPARLEVYEVNLGTDAGTASQSAVDSVVPSLGAGLAVTEHMLLMLRDLGVTTQSIYALTGYSNKFRNPLNSAEHTPLWGMVLDMGGATNGRRPLFLAEQLVNQAMHSDMLEVKLTGENPTWKQVPNSNNDIALKNAHVLQAFAFRDKQRHSLIVFNLDRREPRSITFSGEAFPSGSVAISQLTSAHVTDTNEQKEEVRVVHSSVGDWNSKVPYVLPACSMTVLEWNAFP